MEPEQTKSKWSVVEPLAVTVPKTSGGHQVDIPRKSDHHVYTPSLQLPPWRLDQWKETGRPATRTRLVEEVFIPGRIQARGGKEKWYKKRRSTQKRRLELKC